MSRKKVCQSAYYYSMFGVQLSYLGTAIFYKIYIMYMYTKKKQHFLLFPFSHFSQMRKGTHFVVLGYNFCTHQTFLLLRE
jgi:uncharacterized membrane protein